MPTDPEEEVAAKALAGHRRFLKRVAATQHVWGLQAEPGVWAYCESNEFEDTEVLLFWGYKEDAAKLAIDDWADYEPATIPLDDLVDNWLPGMLEDGLLVGTNWTAQLTGYEIEPDELIEQLHEALE